MGGRDEIVVCVCVVCVVTGGRNFGVGTGAVDQERRESAGVDGALEHLSTWEEERVGQPGSSVWASCSQVSAGCPPVSAAR